jgi:hypothetical protein
MLRLRASQANPINGPHSLTNVSLRTVAYGGFWGMAHEARTDFAGDDGTVLPAKPTQPSNICSHVTGIR